MKRLRESESAEPVIERAKTLLGAVEPLPDSQLRQQRVRRELDRSSRRSRRRSVPAIGLAAAVALFGASAFAAVRFVVERASSPAAEAEAAPNALPPLKHKRQLARTPAREAPEAAPPEPVSPPPAEDATRQRPPAPSEPARRRPRPDQAAAASGEAEPAPEQPAVHDSALVHRAVRALRRQRDPRLAAGLLRQHRRSYPHSPLAEEVLSLQIEAAAALGDARAASLARQYLARYPRGRYAHVARRALPDAAP